ncbi:hypothetical protein GH714_022368 [Hevea brasiliensis]|uniref:Uncharacterized protein n=1 Tax=Hevea brasiliensis TaxID=3981 RepID=A0A6A6N774_HEVBR|nr:hypothetical protein GH714_022368 [Hevea brasiliensis]
MDLSYSCSLTRVPNLSSIAPDLEFLYLNGCPSLAEIPSLQNLSKFVELHMRCSKLNRGVEEIRIPDLSSIAPNLEFLYLDNCKSLVEIPFFENLSNLVELHMRYSKLMQPWSRGNKPLGKLKLMDLSYTSNLIGIPDLSSIAPNLEFLYLTGCWSLVEIPSLQNPLRDLKLMDLSFSHQLISIPDLSSIAPNLEFLHLRRCTSLVEIPSLQNLSKLTELNLSKCS